MTASIFVPLENFTGFSFETLDRLMQSKGQLIARACGVGEVKTAIEDGCVRFELPKLSEDTIPAASDLFASIVAYVTAHPHLHSRSRTSGNDRYAFRCFMLRLGLSGDAHRQTRLTLLANLPGDAAFLHGRPPRT